MARTWGPWSATSSTGARYRVAVDYTVSGTRVTVNGYYFESAYSIAKNVTLTRNGALSGSYSVRVSTSGGVVSMGRGGSVTGSRGGSVTIGGRVTNILHGLTCSVSVKVNIPAAVPSKPAVPTVSGVTNSGFKATVAAPAANGAAITQYEWRIENLRTGGASNHTTSGRTYTHRNSAANSNSRVRVRARNSAGWSAWSGWRSFTTKANGPAAPTGVSVSRSSDTRQNVSWTRRATSAAPYTSQRVQRRLYNANGWSSWVTIATVSATATSYADTSTVANRSYEYRVQAVNASGTATSAASPTARTTPAAPSNVSARKSGNNIIVTWTSNQVYSPVEYEVQARGNGGAWSTLATVSDTTWTHTSPDASQTWQYRVRVKNTRFATLYSAYSALSNIVQLQAPPLAPTLHAVVSSTRETGDDTDRIDTAGTVRFEWTHNAVDTSDQTAAQIRYRATSSSAWSTVTRTGTNGEYEFYERAPFSAGTYEWQVRTRGDHASYGPWSSSRTFVVSERHVTSIIEPDTSIVGTSIVEFVWDNLPSGQNRYEVELLQDGSLLRSASASTTSTTWESPVLDNQSEYTFRVRTKQSTGLWSEWESLTFETDFPAPRCMAPELMFDEVTGSVGLSPVTIEPVQEYRWTGERNESTSEALVDGEVVATNYATNPSFEAVGDEVVLRENLAEVPIPTLESWRGPVSATYGVTLVDEAPPEMSEQTAARGQARGMALLSDRSINLEKLGAIDHSVGIPVEEEQEYTASVFVRNDDVAGWRCHFKVSYYDSGGSQIGSIESTDGQYLPDGGVNWFRASGTFMTPPATTHVIIGFMCEDYDGAYGQRAGYATGFMLTEGNELIPYMDGNSTPSAGLSTEWTDGPNASPSLIRYTGVQGVEEEGDVIVATTTDWSRVGIRSLLVIPTGDDPDGRAVLASDDSPMGLEAGGTYTASITFRQEEATGLTGEAARRIGFWDGDSLVTDDQAQDIDGRQDLAITFTVPEEGSWELALTHGGTDGDAPQFWDALMINQGETPEDYFDGDRLSTVGADSIEYERSINGGPWEMIARNVDPEAAIVDPLPDVGGVNCYRITAWTDSGASNTCEARCLVLYDGTQECPDFSDIISDAEGEVTGDPIPVLAAYINAGTNYDQVCRAEIELRADDAGVGVVQRVLHHFSRRDYPTEFSGRALSHQVDLAFDAPANERSLPGSGLSTVGEWFDIARAAGPHFYRDPWGRHWQASISTTPARREGTKVRAMEFTVTRVDDEPFVIVTDDDDDDEVEEESTW